MSAPCFDLRDFTRRIVALGIRAADGPDDMRERVAIAYRDGHLTDDERDVWLTLCDLETAQ